MAAVQAADYLVFVLESIYYVRWIGFGSFEKPPHYVPGSLSSVKWFVNACIWLFVLDGGQVFPQRASPMSYFGLVFTMLVLSVGLFSIRALAISSKYRRLTKAAHR